MNATGKNREGVCSVEAKSEDLPAKYYIGFFGLKNDMFLQITRARCFGRTRLDEDPNLFCFFVACPPQIPRGGGQYK